MMAFNRDSSAAPTHCQNGEGLLLICDLMRACTVLFTIISMLAGFCYLDKPAFFSSIGSKKEPIQIHIWLLDI